MDKKEKIELERKWLLTQLPLVRYDQIRWINQIYKEESSHRIREEKIYNKARKDFKFQLVINQPDEIVYEETVKTEDRETDGNIEKNTPLSFHEFQSKKSEFKNPISKIRHVIEIDGFKYEVDDFSCHFREPICFVMLEVEFDSVEQMKNFSMSEEFNKYVIKEVTGDKTFGNFSLSKKVFYGKK